MRVYTIRGYYEKPAMISGEIRFALHIRANGATALSRCAVILFLYFTDYPRRGESSGPQGWVSMSPH